jgi:uncharacterized Rossmann fold enzyme
MDIKRMLILAAIAVALVLGTTAFLQQEKKQNEAAPQMKQLLEQDHSISLKEAKELIKNHNIGLKGASVKAEAFNRKAFEQILAQKGCAGIRIYYAQKKDGAPALVLVGFDAKGNDMAKLKILEKGSGCPPMCDYTSDLLK